MGRLEEPRLNVHVSSSGFPALVLNADFRPLSYYPLSLWSWQDAIKAVFLERVNIVANYDRAVHSPSLEMKLPSVVSLKTCVKPSTHPAFTRFNVFLRDRFSCQYCGEREDLTFDHLLPRSRGGHTTWINVVTACSDCNLRKGNLTPPEAKMYPSQMQSEQAVTTLIQVVCPPRERGSKWSKVKSSRSPQYWQEKRSRKNTLNRVKAGWVEGFTKVLSDTTLGSLISRLGLRTARS